MVPGRRLEVVVEILESGGGQAQETPLPGDKMKQSAPAQCFLSWFPSPPFLSPSQQDPQFSPYFTKQLTRGHGPPAGAPASPASPKSMPLPLPCRAHAAAPAPLLPPARGTRSLREGSGEEGVSPAGPLSPAAHREAPRRL